MRRALSAVVFVLAGFTQLLAQQQRVPPAAAPASAIAIRAGRLIDPDAGTAAANQIILVENGKITAVGGNVQIPAGAEVIDLSTQTVLPGLVEAHNHLTMTLVETVPLYGSQLYGPHVCLPNPHHRHANAVDVSDARHDLALPRTDLDTHSALVGLSVRW